MSVSTMKWYLKYALIEILIYPWNVGHNFYYSPVTKKFYGIGEIMQQEGRSLTGGMSLSELIDTIKEFLGDMEENGQVDEDYWKRVTTLSGFNKIPGVRL